MTAMERNSAALQLKHLRLRSGLSIRDVAKSIGRSASTYRFYEETFKKKYIPLELAEELVPIFEPHGISEAETLAIAGLFPKPAEDGHQNYTEAPDVDKDAMFEAASGRSDEHIALRTGPTDEAVLYAPWSGQALYDRLDDILEALGTGANVGNAHVWQLRSGALDLAGYLPGDFMIVDLDASPRPGDVVCAHAGEPSHLVVRRYLAPHLISTSSSPRYREPILLDEITVIKGVVIASFRLRA